MIVHSVGAGAVMTAVRASPAAHQPGRARAAPLAAAGPLVPCKAGQHLVHHSATKTGTGATASTAREPAAGERGCAVEEEGGGQGACSPSGRGRDEDGRDARRWMDGLRPRDTAMAAAAMAVCCAGLAGVGFPPDADAASVSASAAATGGGSLLADAGLVLLPGTLVGNAWSGLLAGAAHALAGPDHLAALAPISIGRSGRDSATHGAAWGAGHEVGQLGAACLFLALRPHIPISLDDLAPWAGILMGATLLLIGAAGLCETLEAPSPPSHPAEGASTSSSSKGPGTLTASFAAGIGAGVQPDGLLILLPLVALPVPEAAAFLATFLVGTVCSMGAYAGMVSRGVSVLGEGRAGVERSLSLGTSGVALALGAALLTRSVGVVPDFLS